MDPAHILGTLFLGSYWSAVDSKVFEAHNIVRVVNCTDHCSNFFEHNGVEYLKLHLDDVTEEPAAQDGETAKRMPRA